MSRKAPLSMMELMVMIAVFALAAALCLQAFVKSDQLSKRVEARDTAAVLCQSAAETLRHTKGDIQQAAQLLGAQHSEAGSFMVDYDKDWALAEDSMRYTLGASLLESDLPTLGRAQIWCRDEENDEELFRLEISWQREVTAHG